MILTFYARARAHTHTHIYVFDADDELRLHKRTAQKGCKYKLLTEGSTRFQ
jgi:hypothetical protein